MTSVSAPPVFTELDRGLGMGPDPGGTWRPLRELPLLIIVGVTGVGKSTTVAALQSMRPKLQLLPNRRTLTDWLIIGALQQADKEPLASVVDRTRRFAYTRRYRTQHPGGMAHALATLLIDTAALPGLLLFDGLRGANEVRSAAEEMPHARFVMLDAPDAVRVQRLLGRQDRFDQAELPAGVAVDIAQVLPEADGLLTPAELDALLRLIDATPDGRRQLRAKLKIVAEERRSYDPLATRDALLTAAPERSLIVDTVQHDPAAAAAACDAALHRWGLVP